MNIFAIPPLFSFVASFLFGLLVLSKNIRSKTNITFALLCFSCSLWLFGYSLMYLSNTPDIALEYAKIGFLGIIFIPIFEFHFIITFLNLKIKNWIIPLLYALTIPSAIISRTNCVYNGIEKYFWGFYPTAGSLYFIFLSMFAILFGTGVILLFFEWKKTINEKKYSRANQILYVLVAFAGGTTGLVDYIIKYKIVIYPWGYISALFFIVIITYAIVKHRLMDIEIIIKKTIFYSLLTACLTAIYFVSVFLTEEIFRATIGYTNLLGVILASFIIMLIFQPLWDRIQTLVDNLFFKGKYDYQEALIESSEPLTMLTDLPTLLKLMSRIVSRKMLTKGSSILIYDEIKDKYVIKAGEGDGRVFIDRVIPSNSPLIEHIKKKRAVLVKEEVDQALAEILKQFNAAVCIPAVWRGKLIAALFLGEKRSGDLFNSQDLFLLL